MGAEGVEERGGKERTEWDTGWFAARVYAASAITILSAQMPWQVQGLIIFKESTWR